MRVHALSVLCLLGLQPAALLAWPDPRSPAPSPPLRWLAVTPDGEGVQGVAALRDWLASEPVPSRADLRLGLLAEVPDAAGQSHPRILQPAVSLSTPRVWPEATRHRAVTLVAGGEVSTPDPAHLRLLLPVMPARAGLRVLQAQARLPVSELPDQTLDLAVVCEEPGSGVVRWSGDLPAAVRSHWLTVDLSKPLQAWQDALGAGNSVRWSLAFKPRPPATGRWQSASPTAPMTWQLSWQTPAYLASGREHLRELLAGLLPWPDRWPQAPGVLQSSWRAVIAQQPASRETSDAPSAEACGPEGGLFLGSDAVPADPPEPTSVFPHTLGMAWHGDVPLAERLDRWRDQQVAPPLQFAMLQPRRLLGRVVGQDLIGLQPVPGRQFWPGQLQPLQCTAEACSLGEGLRSDRGWQAVWQDTQASWPALTEIGVAEGQALIPAGLSTAAQRTGTRPAEAVLQWLPVPGQAAGALLQLSQDGHLRLLSGQRAHPHWSWAPAAWTAVREAWRADIAQAMPGSLSDSVLTSDLQHWQDPTSSDGGQSIAARLAGRVVALDLREPLSPRKHSLPDLPADLRVGSLLLFSMPSRAERPLLLLASAPDSAVQGLWLIDLLSSRISWQAAPQASPGVEVTVTGLTAGWRAGWHVLALETGLRLTSVDASGKVWQLRLDTDGRPTAPPLQLAQLDAPGRVFDLAPSLAWLRDAHGLRQQVIAVLARAHSEPSSHRLMVWQDAATRAAPVTLGELAVWPAGTSRPPLHDRGWWRDGQVGEWPLAAPQWFRQDVVLTLLRRQSSLRCDSADWRQVLVRAPWRRDSAAGQPERQLQEQTAADGLIRQVRIDERTELPGFQPDGTQIPGNTLETGLTSGGWRRRIGHQRLTPR